MILHSYNIQHRISIRYFLSLKPVLTMKIIDNCYDELSKNIKTIILSHEWYS